MAIRLERLPGDRIVVPDVAIIALGAQGQFTGHEDGTGGLAQCCSGMGRI